MMLGRLFGERGIIKGIFNNAVQISAAIFLARSVTGVWVDITSETEVSWYLFRKRIIIPVFLGNENKFH
jgi:hypothetical protein